VDILIAEIAEYGVLKIPIPSVTIYEIQEGVVYGGEFHVSM
jgi:hypothetical protein